MARPAQDGVTPARIDFILLWGQIGRISGNGNEMTNADDKKINKLRDIRDFLITCRKDGDALSVESAITVLKDRNRLREALAASNDLLKDATTYQHRAFIEKVLSQLRVNNALLDNE